MVTKTRQVELRIGTKMAANGDERKIFFERKTRTRYNGLPYDIIDGNINGRFRFPFIRNLENCVKVLPKVYKIFGVRFIIRDLQREKTSRIRYKNR